MSQSELTSRRDFLNRSVAAAGAVGAAAAVENGGRARAAAGDSPAQTQPVSVVPEAMPCGTIGKARISRLLLGGNLVSGCMHARDLHYVESLFRAYVTEAKMMQTLALAEKCGINTVFETGATFVEKYNRQHNGRMQFIPHIQVNATQSEQELKDHIKRQVDQGAVALYVWGVAGDQLVSAGAVDRIGRAVELAKLHGLPVGVGSHSLLVPMACEKHQVPCDYYVKTLHSDNYPSATPKELRKEFMWLSGGKGWYDNMWCINPEQTIEFMKTVAKPWIAFKVLVAGALLPRDGFTFAFKNGADFIAVGMFDFQIQENCSLASRLVREHQERERPWHS
jgi:hypothetical protein